MLKKNTRSSFPSWFTSFHAQRTASGGLDPIELAAATSARRIPETTAPQGHRVVSSVDTAAAEPTLARRFKHTNTDTYGLEADGEQPSADLPPDLPDAPPPAPAPPRRMAFLQYSTSEARNWRGDSVA